MSDIMMLGNAIQNKISFQKIVNNLIQNISTFVVLNI